MGVTIREFVYGGTSRPAVIGTYVGSTVRYCIFGSVAVSALLYWAY